MTIEITTAIEAGKRLQQDGKFQEAEALCRQLLLSSTGNAEVWHLLGLVCHQQGKSREATESIRRAISFDSTKASLFNNYGAALQSSEMLVDAITAFRAALQLNSGYRDANFNLVAVLNQLRQWEAATRAAAEALVHCPDDPGILLQGAVAAEHSGTIDFLLVWLARLVDMMRQSSDYPLPDRAQLLRKLGHLLFSQLRSSEAIPYLEESLDIQPDSAATHCLLSRAQAACSDTVSALKSIQRAQRLSPENRAWHLREMVTCPIVFQNREEIEAYWKQLEDNLQRLADEQRAIPRDVLFEIGFVPPFGLAFHGKDARAVKEKFAAVCRPSFSFPSPVPRHSGTPRIGWVVTQGHEGSFVRCVGGIISRINRKEFEVIVACHSQSVDMLRQILGGGISYLPFENNFLKTSSLLAEARCDILYYWEIGTDTLNYFLPFTRSASVQCVSWGSQTTTGLSEVDFYLSSSFVEADDGDSNYTEKVWRLNAFPTWQTRSPQVEPTNKSHFGFANRQHIYVCPQTIRKLHPDVDPLFAEVLRADSSGIVVLKQDRNPLPSKHLMQRMAQSIPDVADRIVMLPWQSSNEYYRLLTIADVILDTPYFSAGSSSYDIFSYHRPIVTMQGRSFSSRYTAGCCLAMGMPELITTAAMDYVQLAVRFANDSEYSDTISRQLAERSSILFEQVSAIKEHENFFRSVIASIR